MASDDIHDECQAVIDGEPCRRVTGVYMLDENFCTRSVCQTCYRLWHAQPERVKWREEANA
jgi:hypothetical protein